MKPTVEQELLAVTARRRPNTAFVTDTMRAVRSQAARAAFERNLNGIKKPKRRNGGLLAKFKQLPVGVVVLVMLLVAVGLSGAVYAFARYAPDLVKITNSAITSRGTKAYWAPAFTNCTTDGTQKFERNKNASQLSDADVQNLITARCEEDIVDGFVSRIWPTYGTNKVWKDGDTIYYARPDAIGTLRSVSKANVVVNESASGTQLKTYNAQPNQQITAYANGVKVPLSSIKAGDTVYVITRVSDIYTMPFHADSSGSVEYMAPTTQTPPKTVGAIGIVKLSQPLRYYGGLQNGLTELPPCMGNAGEYCPSTASIDVYPREGGEGAVNPQLVDVDPSKNREISGMVTELNDATLKLRSSSGKIYMVSVPGDGFSQYNRQYAPAYSDDATLRIGSNVSVLYSMSAKTSAQNISASQVIKVRLMLDGDVKQGTDQQY
ncbi:MAG TPA: hypothetical protein VLG16_03375 [Candidatus Saccharimonadales bacterium]|nr:hypothetical protein [Candidatus Saccharimonadales bacterium]